MPKLLITGWARGGMGYVGKFLALTGRQVDFSVDHTTDRKFDPPNFRSAADVMVSPYLVPFLDRPELLNVPVVFVLRDPMRVFNSVYFHGLLHNERANYLTHFLSRNLDDFLPAVAGRPALATACYLHEWVRLAYKNRADIRWARLEDGPRNLLNICGMPIPTATLPYCAPDVNASACQQTYDLERLPPEGQPLMRALVDRFGYSPSAWMPSGGHAHYTLPEWRH